MDEEIHNEKRSGCGLLNVVFGRRSIWPRRSTSTGSTSLHGSNGNHVTRFPSTPSLQIPRQGFDDPSTFDQRRDRKDRIIERPGKNYSKSPPVYQQQFQQNYYQPRNEPVRDQSRKAPQPGLGISGELENMITDYQKSKGTNGLVRASSSNMMLFGNLGNLKQPLNNSNNGPTNVLDHNSNGRYPTSVIGNVVKKNEEPEKPVSLCRALSTRMDPEQLKILGNEDYKNGRFAEALALYDAAISIDPNKASYRSNKSAALVALGNLLEAAFECREAIRIDPYYQRAHNRLATIYLRLGEAERATYHFKQSGPEADPESMLRAKQVQMHLSRCTEAKRQRDWNTLLRETDLAIDSGADSAPLIFGLKAEALVKLNRHEEAIETMEKVSNFDIDHCLKFFGPVGSSSLLIFCAQVDLVAGRFDDAVATAEQATRLDPSNREASVVLRRTRCVTTARANGNEMFKSGRYSEASIAYGEGLGHDMSNAVLLCNRAACRSKLGQYQKAIEDCNAALKVRSSYVKARLRRADCYAKMGKWGACLQDCQLLLKQNPDDEEICKLMKEAKAQLEGNGQEMSIHSAYGTSMVVVSSNEHFRDAVASRGVSVVLFSTKTENGKIMNIIDQLNQRYPSVNFLKVEVEDHPSLASSEGVNLLPSFIIYANGSRAKEVRGDKYDTLESSIKYFIGS
ncbi:hypothetical protein ACS0TY_029353 [Phlomoides rotata]